MANVDMENERNSWIAFCEKHAKVAASNFAKAFLCFVNSHNADPSTVDHKEFVAKFIDCFEETFETDLASLKAKPNGITAGPSNGFHGSVREESEYSTREVVKTKRPFFRRLSFKALTKGKSFFRQTSDDTDSGAGHSKNMKLDKHSKTRLAKIVVECRKEGIVNYLVGENADGTQKWEKCRLALVKTVGGYMLEFYSPPKSVKPKSGVFCFLIREARETTALEMPDHENTFVLKADNNMEYVIEAHDIDDMKSWLATVKYCMKSFHTTEGDGASVLGSEGKEDEPPELPPRGAEGTEDENEPETDLSHTLKDYPWFHGTLARADAAALVLHTGVAGHGVFLVRQSETRKGEFVLTFNFHGRAKHLRMTIADSSLCRVQHLSFVTIFDMLEHFRQHPIPLESGGTADVTLTHYVVALPPRQPAPPVQQSQSDHTRPQPAPEHPDVLIHAGSIRSRTESIERLTDSQASSLGATRAVENTYSFV